MRVSAKVLLAVMAAAVAAAVLFRWNGNDRRFSGDTANMSQSTSRFLWSDAWLLTAIFWAKRAEGQVSLMKTIAYGDAINHAVFLPEELEGGLARLTEARLIQEVNGHFIPVGDAEAWYAEFVALHENNWDSMQWMKAKLRSDPYHGGRDPRNNRRYPGFTKARYDEALQSYKEWYAEQLARTSTDDKTP